MNHDMQLLNDSPLMEKTRNQPIRRIAVFRALQLGDLLVTIPALRALRHAFPAAEITLISLPWAREFVRRWSHYCDMFLEFPGYPGLPERMPDLAAFPGFVADAQNRRFDLAIQLHGSGSFVNSLTALLGARFSAGFFVPGEYCPDTDLFIPYPPGHEIQRNLELTTHLGAPAQGTHLDFPLQPADYAELRVAAGPHALAAGNYVCIHPGARYLSRRWPAGQFAQVADELSRRGFQVVVTGSPDEADVAAAVCREMKEPQINLAGRTTLGALAALLAGARLLVSNDTGVSHVATAVNTPSVVIVLGSDPTRWAPLDQTLHATIYEPIDCRPCAHFSCPIEHPCATAIAPQRVLAAAFDLLERPGTPPCHESAVRELAAHRNINDENDPCVAYAS